jgi:transmembrane sensor
MVEGPDEAAPDGVDALIERVLRGDASEMEAERVARWRRGSLSNERHYRQLARLVETARALLPSSVDAHVPSAASLLGAPRDATPMRGWSGRGVVWTIGAAAAVAVVTLVGLGRRGTAAGALGPAEVLTGPAETATVRLRDGSVVRLAPASQLRVLDKRGRREVTLDGRAYFAVAPMPNRPFVVTTRLGEAKVLATRFELATDRDELRLVVVEGRVALSARNSIEVRGGEESGVREGVVLPPTRVADGARLHQWVGKFLVFQATPVHDVATEVARAYGVLLLPADSSMAQRTVTATFIDRSAEHVVEVICSVVNARCDWREQEVTMSSR